MTCAGTLEVTRLFCLGCYRRKIRELPFLLSDALHFVSDAAARAHEYERNTHKTHALSLSLSLSLARCVKVRNNAERRAPSLGDRRRRRRRSREEFVFFVFFDFDTQERHQQFSVVEWFSFPGSRFELRDERNGSVDIHRGRDAKNLSRGVLREALASQRGD